MAGGEYTYRQLESLWLSAGGRRSLAPTMAAIAEAESGGNTDAANPSGATGLWQILGAIRPQDQSRLTDPNINAREAVLKYQDQGLGAWTTWSSGAYKRFLQGGSASSPAIRGPAALLDEAEKFVGTPYVWGGESPKGFDCSGLVQYAAQKVGLKVPRTSEEQWSFVQHIPKSQLQPGDLVFYAGSDGTAASPGHVAIYAGNNQIIQAEETGTNVGKFPLGSAGTPVGYGRIPGSGKATFNGTVPGGGGGGGGGTGGTNIQTATLDAWPGESVLQGIPGLNIITNLDQLGNIGGPLGSLANTITRFEHGVEWFFVPSHWMRIICFLIGAPLVGIGVVVMTKGSQPVPVSAGGVSVNVSAGQLAPAVGIVEVVVGACLLFVAFHNLDAAGVKDFPSLLSYFQGALQRQGAQDTGSGA